MKELFEKVSAAVDAAVKAVKRALGAGAATAAAGAVALAIVAAAPQSANAQIGTYVSTRDTLLISGILSAGLGSTNITATNFLNYSGFHRPGFWLTVTNMGAQAEGVALTITPIPILVAGPTNALLGTNVVAATAGSLVWSNTFATPSTNIVFTNSDWPTADSIAGWQITIASSNSTAFHAGWGQTAGYELDMVIAP